jgi:hypothetical protein
VTHAVELSDEDIELIVGALQTATWAWEESAQRSRERGLRQAMREVALAERLMAIHKIEHTYWPTILSDR